MNLEEKTAAYRALCEKIQQLEEEKKLLGQEILAAMPRKKMAFPGYIARIHTRLLIRIPMEQARLLDATKMVEQVDKDKITEIHKSGVALDGVREISYLVIASDKTPLPSEISSDE